MRAVDDQGRTMADVVWMSDVTESIAAINTLTQETATLNHEHDLLKTTLNDIAKPV